MSPDPITDVDLDAYLDGELDLDRRLAVESHLARSPAAAARLMADMRARTALRLASAALEEAPPALRASAERLSARLAERRPLARRLFDIPGFAMLAAGSLAALALVTIVPTNDVRAGTPAYVADAAVALHTGIIRAAMPSQIESRVLDAHDIRRATRIRVPRLPDGWQITDVQIVPSDDGPALQIMVRTSGGDVAALFAVRTPAAAPSSPAVVRYGDTSVAYWRRNDIAYALAGAERPDAINIAARDIADNRID